jgi:hypothetical protein
MTPREVLIEVCEMTPVQITLLDAVIADGKLDAMLESMRAQITAQEEART